MSQEPDIVVLMTAKNTFEAQVVAGILREAGIPVYVAGQSLQDEFAMSQALLNLSRVRIQVPKERLEEARRAVAEADSAAHLLDRDDFDPGPPDDLGDR
jgi:hypothetical protein